MGSALAFKIMTDPFVGSLTFARMYSGVLNKGDSVLNSVKNKKERIGRMLEMNANDRTDIDQARAGDIIALVGCKDTTTGETLCDPENPVILEKMELENYEVVPPNVEKEIMSKYKGNTGDDEDDQASICCPPFSISLSASDHAMHASQP